MVAQTEPVMSWGDEPCGRDDLPTTTCVSAAGSGAPRPPGTGRGNPEVQTLRNSALEMTYGRQRSAGVVERRANNEQEPSHAAASAAIAVALAPSNEGGHRYRSGGGIREVAYAASRISGDLGTACHE